MAAEDSNFIGIDLGTTTCAIGHVDRRGHPTCIPNFEGDVLTPSALLFDGDSVSVGREAVKNAAFAPEGYCDCFKRSMGVSRHPVEVNGESFRPEFLSAVLLKRLQQDVSRQVGEVGRVVVTVPAYYDESRRRGTKAAAAICGWDVAEIINEPTAAAIAWAHRTQQIGTDAEHTRILVYDLGGGTFDTTVLDVRFGREYRTLATDGDVRLGGHDWDTELSGLLMEKFKAETGVDPQSDVGQRRLTEIEFRRMARDAKHTLSSRQKASVPAVIGTHRVLLEVTREEFEARTAMLVERTRSTTKSVLESAGLTWKEIDQVVLIGGSTRMPMITQMLEKESDKEVDRSMSADESVAHGAAVYAQMLAMGSDVRVVNVNAHTLRIIGKKSGKPIAHPMIRRNTELPATRAQVFPAARNGMTSVIIPVCEGESDNPDSCEGVGNLRVQGLPEDDSKQWQVRVTLKYETNGTLAVGAKVMDPDKPGHVVHDAAAELMPGRGLNDNQIAREQKRLSDLDIN